MKEERYQLINQKPGEDNDQVLELEETKFFVINSFDMKFYFKDCKMIQFVDIS